MSLQIGFQKTNSKSYSKDRLVARRHEYNEKTKKTVAGKVIFSCANWDMPDAIPDAKIEANKVTESEHQIYKDFVQAEKLRMKNATDKSSVRNLIRRVKETTEALESRTEGVDIGEIEALDVAISSLKAEMKRHKRNAKKRGDSGIQEIKT